MSDSEMSPGLQAFCKAYDADSPESAMRIACSSLLSSCGLGEPPVPLIPLLRKLGIELRRVRGKRTDKTGNIEARLAAKKGGLIAYLYEDDNGRSWRRARFSLAHEIGHGLLIHALGNPALIASLEETPERYRRVERLCDLAASEILMPASAVRKASRKADFSPQGLVRLYDEFLVSRDALVRRLATVMPHASVVKWKVYARTEEEPRTMRVVRSFPGYEGRGLRPWLPYGCTTRHLDPPIVDWAASRNEAVLEGHLRINLRGRSQECVGLATFFPVERPREYQPSFDGFRIPDEGPGTPEILLFAADKVMAGDSVAREFKKK